MKKRIIDFAYNYKKLHGQKTAKLIMCISDFPGKLIKAKYSHFLMYDMLRDNYSSLAELDENQKYLLLIFLGDKGLLFTTLRTDNIENRDKYADFVGADFEINIEDKRAWAKI